MAIQPLTEEQLEYMSYADVAKYILENSNKPLTIQDLFKKVIKLMNLSESDFEERIFDFFQLLSDDHNFIMLEKGMWDLTIRHSNKISISKESLTDEDDEEESEIEEEMDEEENTSEVNYDDDSLDDDLEEDDYKDLVIVNDDELDQES